MYDDTESPEHEDPGEIDLRITYGGCQCELREHTLHEGECDNQATQNSDKLCDRCRNQCQGILRMRAARREMVAWEMRRMRAGGC
jgi:hypothetical protein